MVDINQCTNAVVSLIMFFFNLPSFNIKIFESAFYISLSSYDSAKSADPEEV